MRGLDSDSVHVMSESRTRRYKKDFFFFLNDSVNHSHFNLKPILILYINIRKKKGVVLRNSVTFFLSYIFFYYIDILLPIVLFHLSVSCSGCS